MPEYDPERLEVADGLRRQLAIENELSRPQARAFVRCLQTSWQVQTIQWTERDSNGQLSDARRLLHAAHVFREIEGPGSRRAIDCRSEEHTSELRSLMRISYAVFCLKK